MTQDPLQVLPITRRVKQSQVVGICILSGDCGRKIVYVDVKKEGCQDRSLREAVLVRDLTRLGIELKAFASDKTFSSLHQLRVNLMRNFLSSVWILSQILF